MTVVDPANPKPRGTMASLAVFAESIKFQHTVFALPFAVLGVMLGVRVNCYPGAWVLLLALICCITARTAAMTFNRWLDADIDALNPRTANRAVPAGLLTRNFMIQATVLNSGVFVMSAWLINSLAGLLAPVALIILLGYSATKRFTSLCHLVLGLALAIAPSGGYIAVTGRLDWAPVLMSLGVMLWTAGFDIIYACQDEEFDRQSGLHSIPARLGYGKALMLAATLHLGCLPAFFLAGWIGQLGSGYLVGCGAVALILLVQHVIVHRLGPRGIPMAFFTVNGWTGIALLAITLAGQWLGGNHP